MGHAIPLQEFPIYDALDAGLIVNRQTGRAIRGSLNRSGHVKVGLRHDGKQHTRVVSRLIAEAFLESPTSPEFNTPIHLDGNLQNCAASNLMWRPLWFARQYHEQFQTMYYNKARIRNRKTGDEFDNCYAAASTYGALPVAIYFNAANYESGYDNDSVWPGALRFEISI
jgi:hypothetical protein